MATATLTLSSPFHATQPRPGLIAQGAEGYLLKTVFVDAARPAALKIRPSKTYRHNALDSRLTKQRILAEARILVKLVKLGLAVPAVFEFDWKTSVPSFPKERSSDQELPVQHNAAGAWILMEWIEGTSVRRLLQRHDRLAELSSPEKNDLRTQNVRTLLRRIGWAVGLMHHIGCIVHGDLTSSNIMVRPYGGMKKSTSRSNTHNDGRPSNCDDDDDLDGEIVLIDFGLASQSIQDEDRAVDLYVLERAFGSTHPKQESLVREEVLESQYGYRGSFKGSSTVLKRLENVRARGRKRSMVG